MKITKIVLMLIIGVFASVQVLAYESPAVDKIASLNSIYVSQEAAVSLDLDFRPLASSGDATLAYEVNSYNPAFNVDDGGKAEVGWRHSA